MESLLIAHHFHSDMLVGFVIERLHNLPEAAFTYHLQDFIAVCYMIMWYMDV